MGEKAILRGDQTALPMLQGKGESLNLVLQSRGQLLVREKKEKTNRSWGKRVCEEGRDLIMKGKTVNILLLEGRKKGKKRSGCLGPYLERVKGGEGKGEVSISLWEPRATGRRE